MPKKEALLLGRELEKLQKNLGGIRNMSKRPDAVFILDTKKEHIAVTEANKLKIPVIAVVDTNVDPDVIQFPIPGNDDAIRANALMSRVIAEAIEEGRFIASKRNPQAGAAASEPPRTRPPSPPRRPTPAVRPPQRRPSAMPALLGPVRSPTTHLPRTHLRAKPPSRPTQQRPRPATEAVEPRHRATERRRAADDRRTESRPPTPLPKPP